MTLSQVRTELFTPSGPLPTLVCHRDYLQSAVGGAVTAAIDHPLARFQREAALGSFPEYTRTVESVGSLPGPCDAVAFLPGHTVVAADIDQQWLDENAAYQQTRSPEDRSTGLGMGIAALRERLGNPPTYASVVTAAPHRTKMLRARLDRQRDDAAHPGWAAYRTDIESYRYDGGATQGRIDLGRGPGGRLDVYIEVDTSPQGGGAPSRDLLAAALTMVPAGEQLFGSAPVHDIRALRTMLAGGFTPICTEVLFLTRPVT